MKLLSKLTFLVIIVVSFLFANILFVSDAIAQSPEDVQAEIAEYIQSGGEVSDAILDDFAEQYDAAVAAEAETAAEETDTTTQTVSGSGTVTETAVVETTSATDSAVLVITKAVESAVLVITKAVETSDVDWGTVSIDKLVANYAGWTSEEIQDEIGRRLNDGVNINNPRIDKLSDLYDEAIIKEVQEAQAIIDAENARIVKEAEEAQAKIDEEKVAEATRIANEAAAARALEDAEATRIANEAAAAQKIIDDEVTRLANIPKTLAEIQKEIAALIIEDPTLTDPRFDELSNQYDAVVARGPERTQEIIAAREAQGEKATDGTGLQGSDVSITPSCGNLNQKCCEVEDLDTDDACNLDLECRQTNVGALTIAKTCKTSSESGAITPILNCPAPKFPDNKCQIEGTDFIQFAWNAVNGAEIYNVEWCPAGTDFEFGNSACGFAIKGPGTVYRAEGLEPNTNYNFRVNVLSSDETKCRVSVPSPLSDIASCKTKALETTTPEETTTPICAEVNQECAPYSLISNLPCCLGSVCSEDGVCVKNDIGQFTEGNALLIYEQYEGELLKKDYRDAELNVIKYSEFLKRFYATQTDDYDFLIVDTPAKLRSSQLVSLHRETFGRDEHTLKIYTERLRAIAIVTYHNRYNFDKKIDNLNEQDLGTTLHEIGHEWCCFTDINEQRNLIHWPNNLDLFDGDSRYVDLLSFYQWVVNDEGEQCLDGNDRENVERKFSDFTLYLMGLMPASEVIPIKFHEFEKKEGDENSFYNVHGPTCNDERKFTETKEITTQEFVNKYGIRTQSYETSQKNFNVAYVIIVPYEENIDRGYIEYVNGYSVLLPESWSRATNQRSEMTVADLGKYSADLKESSAVTVAILPQCNDGIDNDGDGFVDYNGLYETFVDYDEFLISEPDSGCDSPQDDDEGGVFDASTSQETIAPSCGNLNEICCEESETHIPCNVGQCIGEICVESEQFSPCGNNICESQRFTIPTNEVKRIFYEDDFSDIKLISVNDYRGALIRVNGETNYDINSKDGAHIGEMITIGGLNFLVEEWEVSSDPDKLSSLTIVLGENAITCSEDCGLQECISSEQFDQDGDGKVLQNDIDACVNSAYFQEEGYPSTSATCDFNGDCKIDYEDIDILDLHVVPVIFSFEVLPFSGKPSTMFQFKASIYGNRDDSGVIFVSATIMKNGNTINELILYNDGEHGDRKRDDNIYGNVWDSSGKTPGEYEVEIRAIDENHLENTQILLFEISDEELCKEFIPGHNDQDSSRMNIVLVGINYENLVEFENHVGRAIDFDGKFGGIFSQEPFRSNKNKFNIWYVGKLGEFEGNFNSPGGYRVATSLMSICTMNNKQSIGLVKSSIISSAGETDAHVSTISKPWEWIAIHEFGHSFGNLADEYLTNAAYEDDEDSLGFLQMANRFIGSAEQCLSPTNSWYDFIGNGCGAEGEIDCVDEYLPTADVIECNTLDIASCFTEVACYEGNGYSGNSFRPGFTTVMRSRNIGSEHFPYVFGQVNIKAICDEIERFTGSAEGICLQLPELRKFDLTITGFSLDEIEFDYLNRASVRWTVKIKNIGSINSPRFEVNVKIIDKNQDNFIDYESYESILKPSQEVELTDQSFLYPLGAYTPGDKVTLTAEVNIVGFYQEFNLDNNIVTREVVI